MCAERWFCFIVHVFLACIAPSFLFSSAAAWGDSDVLLSMPEPPDGYMVMKQPVEVDGKRLGQTVVVVKEGSPARVLITVETSFDRSAKPARVAATKGYVNGMAASLKNMGMQLIDSKLPDLERADFTTPLQVDMTFAQSDGTKLYTRQFVFFSKNGHNVQIASTDPQDVETLAKWAQHIKPAD